MQLGAQLQNQVHLQVLAQLSPWLCDVGVLCGWFLLCKLLTVLHVFTISLVACMQDAHVQAMLQQALRSNLTVADTTSAAESPLEAKPEASSETRSPSRLDNDHKQQEACSSAKGAVRAQEPCPAKKVQEPAQLASNAPLTDFTAQQVSTGSLSCLHITISAQAAQVVSSTGNRC